MCIRDRNTDYVNTYIAQEIYTLKILLPSLINDGLFDFQSGVGWKEIYQKYEDEGVDRNPIVHHLEDHGISHVQFWINHEKGQKSWADEHNVKYGEKSWYLDILEAQILHEKPDVIYNTTLTVIPYDFIRKIKGCLLYTSPSPRDATLSRMPSSA